MFSIRLQIESVFEKKIGCDFKVWHHRRPQQYSNIIIDVLFYSDTSHIMLLTISVRLNIVQVIRVRKYSGYLIEGINVFTNYFLE